MWRLRAWVAVAVVSLACPTSQQVTPAPDTLVPATVAPDTPLPPGITIAPDTLAPAMATVAPDTPAPATPAPATLAPDTPVPPPGSTPAPPTPAPAGVTSAPDTLVPATVAPDTPLPPGTTFAPDTLAPAVSTAAPDTSAPAGVTVAPDTPAPATAAPDTPTPMGTAAPDTPLPQGATLAPDTPSPPAATTAPDTAAPPSVAPDTPLPPSTTVAPTTTAPDTPVPPPGSTPAPPTPAPTAAPDTPAPPPGVTVAPDTPLPPTPRPDTPAPDTAMPPPPPPSGVLPPEITVLEQDRLTIVSIRNPTPGNTVYYTLDGSDPDLPTVNNASLVYSGEIIIYETGTVIRAVAWNPDAPQGANPFSPPASAVISVAPVSGPPKFNPSGRLQLTGAAIRIFTGATGSTPPAAEEEVLYVMCPGETCASPLSPDAGGNRSSVMTYSAAAPVILESAGVWTYSAVVITTRSGATAGAPRRPSEVTSVTFDVSARCRTPAIATPSARYIDSVTLSIDSPDSCTPSYLIRKEGVSPGAFTRFDPLNPAAVTGVGNYTVQAVGQGPSLTDSEPASTVVVVVAKPAMLAARVTIEAATSLRSREDIFKQSLSQATGVDPSRVVVHGSEKDTAPEATQTLILKFSFSVAPTVSAEEKSSDYLAQQIEALPLANLRSAGVEGVWKDGEIAPPLNPPPHSPDDSQSANALLVILACVVGAAVLGLIVFCCCTRRQTGRANPPPPNPEPRAAEPNASKIQEKELEAWVAESDRHHREVPLLEAASPPTPAGGGAAVANPQATPHLRQLEVVEERSPPPPPITSGQTFARPHDYRPLPQLVPSPVGGSPPQTQQESTAGRFTTPVHPDAVGGGGTPLLSRSPDEYPYPIGSAGAGISPASTQQPYGVAGQQGQSPMAVPGVVPFGLPSALSSAGRGQPGGLGASPPMLAGPPEPWGSAGRGEVVPGPGMDAGGGMQQPDLMTLFQRI